MAYRYLVAVFLLACLLGCNSKARTGALVVLPKSLLLLDRVKTSGLSQSKKGLVFIHYNPLFRSLNRESFRVSPNVDFSTERGIIGGTRGAIVGIALDASDRKALDQESPRTTRKIDGAELLSTTDIKKMTKAGLSDDVTIGQIDATRSIFHLSSADIIDLKKAGVSQRVINHMIQTSG
jgi:hypothetical protein